MTDPFYSIQVNSSENLSELKQKLSQIEDGNPIDCVTQLIAIKLFNIIII